MHKCLEMQWLWSLACVLLVVGSWFMFAYGRIAVHPKVWECPSIVPAKILVSGQLSRRHIELVSCSWFDPCQQSIIVFVLCSLFFFSFSQQHQICVLYTSWKWHSTRLRNAFIHATWQGFLPENFSWEIREQLTTCYFFATTPVFPIGHLWNSAGVSKDSASAKM